MYDFQIDGEMFKPIGILQYKYDALPKDGSIAQYLFAFSESLSVWNTCFKSSTDRTLHCKLPNTENVFLSNGYAKLFLAILMFECLKSVTTLYLL